MTRQLFILLACAQQLGAQAPTPRPGTDPIIQAPAPTLDRTHAARPTSSAITEGDLITRLFIVAADSMEGREAGTIGSVRATQYIANEARRMGLTPAGDDHSYFQTLPFKTRFLDSVSSLRTDSATFTAKRDWLPIGGASYSIANGLLVFAGALRDTSGRGPDDRTNSNVVFFTHQGPINVNWIFDRAPNAVAAVIQVPDSYLSNWTTTTQVLDDPSRPVTGLQKVVLFVTASTAAKMFRGPVGALAIGDTGRRISFDVKYAREPTPFPARNVVAVLPGSDPRLNGEYIVLGAHSDHLGVTRGRTVDHDSARIFLHNLSPGGGNYYDLSLTPDMRASRQQDAETLLKVWRADHTGSTRLDSTYNGADDDGSGVVSLLEVAENLASARIRPKRSILFVWHVAEEKGLLGSIFFTDHPTVPRDSIVAQLNLDMVGRGMTSDVVGQEPDGTLVHGGPRYLQVIGSRRVSTELGDLVDETNKRSRFVFSIDYSMEKSGRFCRSDQYSYARYGIPIAYFSTGAHSDYHQVTDESQYINYDKLARVSVLVRDVALNLANAKKRLTIDHPMKADPNAICRE